MAESSEACSQCQGTSWTLSDGVLVCEICGTQSQVSAFYSHSYWSIRPAATCALTARTLRMLAAWLHMVAGNPRVHVPLQLFVQEQQEFQTGIDDLRYRRRAGGLSRRPASAQASEHVPPDVDTIHAMLVTYSKALQHALQVSASLAYVQSTTRTSCSMLTLSSRQACCIFS